MKLERFTFGVGDRFAQQGKAQLQAFLEAEKAGVEICPVWNKSHREHQIIGTEPGSVRLEANAAVDALGWEKNFYVDADHIQLGNVDGFIEASDFFTLDVAESIGKEAGAGDRAAFVDQYAQYVGTLEIPGLEKPLEITKEKMERVAGQYLAAVQEVGAIYRHVADKKGAENFVTEVSMDETAEPQTPDDLLWILAMIAGEGIPAQTLAPKFSGRFNKGVDYVGVPSQFEAEFKADVAILAYAIQEFHLPENLKLSVHSGSDKFSIYPSIAKVIGETGAGLHLKTAGTTWLEELIGLAEAEGEGLAIAKEVYRDALDHYEALCAPYASVIDIDPAQLPPSGEVAGWDGQQYARTLRHDQADAMFNPHFRQLLHVGYKVAAQMGERYLNCVRECEEHVARNVLENLVERHMKPLFFQ